MSEYYLIILNLLMFIYLVYGTHKVHKFQEQYKNLIDEIGKKNLLRK